MFEKYLMLTRILSFYYFHIGMQYETDFLINTEILQPKMLL